MLYAKGNNGDKVRATPKDRALCPFCDNEVIAKCGDIKIWHWAHISESICDSWSEGETDWHLYWKSLFPSNMVEVTIEKDGIKHRADVITQSGIVVELQHSYISPADIEEREWFYGDMRWLFDIRDCRVYDDEYGYRFALNTDNLRHINPEVAYCTFRWKHPRKSLWYAESPVYLDIDEYIFKVGHMYHNIPCGGWGHLITKGKFSQIMLTS